MAQIIKHRRGSVSALKDVTANVGELVMATGSIGDFNGPIIFVGDTAVAGGYKPVSKIYQGTTAPTISVGSHGSTMDGIPFYSINDKTLYILDKSGNIDIDLTGNIEGNTISGVTINNLTGTTAYIANVSGSFTGSGMGLYDIPASGITGLELNKIASGSATASISPNNGLRINVKTEVTGSLTVSGDTYTSGNVYITGNTSQTGSIDLTGDIILGGNITIGNQTTDIIQFGGEVSSSILPIIHNAFDLGSSSKNWRNLHVSGTAYVDTLEAQQVNFNDLGILTDLTVSGSTYLGNGGDITVVSGSLYNDQLTEKRLVVVGADGLITDYSGLTFDNGNLNLSGALEVTNIQGTGSLYLQADKNDLRHFEIYNTSTVDTHIKSNGGLSFFGDDTNYLKIDDSLQTATLVGVNGVIVSSSLQVTGSVFTDKILGTGSLYLQPDQIDGRYFEIYNTGASDVHIKSSNGLSFFGDDTNYLKIDDFSQTATIVGVNGVLISSSLNVTGSSILSSTLEVKGATGLNSTLDVTGSATLKSTLQVDSTSQLKGAVGMNSSLDVTGSAQFKSTINVDGIATVSSSVVEDLTQYRVVGVGSGGALIDYSGLTYNGTVLQIGGGQFEVDNADGDIRTSGSLTVEGGQTINGDVTVNGVLTVTGNTQLGANLYVSGNLEVLGSSTNVNLQSTTVEIGDNIILVNAYSPFQRYAGITGYDSGSVGTSGSLLWDSLNDYWLLQNSNASTSKVIGTTSGSMGTEVSLTDTYFPIATGANTIGDSLLRYSGTTLSFNTNKFTIDSGNGDTAISGNVTLSYSGGTDSGTLSSTVVFRNGSNVLGYVSSTDTQNVTTQLLGYNNSTGVLEFSSVVDGGTY
jgi:cytoskeletal protein CcmA (bactofilin family)